MSPRETAQRFLIRVFIFVYFRNLRHEHREFVHSAALRCLEYVMDTVGCSIASQFGSILEALFESLSSHCVRGDVSESSSQNMACQFSVVSRAAVALSFSAMSSAVAAAVPLLFAQRVRVLRSAMLLGAKFSAPMQRHCMASIILPRMRAAFVPRAELAPSDSAMSTLAEYQLQLLLAFVAFGSRLKSEALIDVSDLFLCWHLSQTAVAVNHRAVSISCQAGNISQSLSSIPDFERLLAARVCWESVSADQAQLGRDLFRRATQLCVSTLVDSISALESRDRLVPFLEWSRLLMIRTIILHSDSVENAAAIDRANVDFDSDAVAALSQCFLSMLRKPAASSESLIPPASQISAGAEMFQLLQVLRQVVSAAHSRIERQNNVFSHIQAATAQSPVSILPLADDLPVVSSGLVRIMHTISVFLSNCIHAIVAASGNSIEAASTVELWSPLWDALLSIVELQDQVSAYSRLSRRDVSVLPPPISPSANVHLVGFIDVITRVCRQSAPSATLLAATRQLVLRVEFPDRDEAVARSLLALFESFLPWVPQSVLDGTFELIEAILQLATPACDAEHCLADSFGQHPSHETCWLPAQVAVERVLRALLDRCTVHSQSYRVARQALVHFFTAPRRPRELQHDLISSVFRFCLAQRASSEVRLQSSFHSHSSSDVQVIGTRAPAPPSDEATEECLAFLLECCQDISYGFVSTNFIKFHLHFIHHVFEFNLFLH